MDNIDKGLTRFTESFSCTQENMISASMEEVKESFSKAPGRIRESVKSENGDDTKGYWVPISFYNKKNLNKRIYNKKLWENVIEKQRGTYVGSPMLSDHPQGENDGNPKDICGVWLDGKVGEPGPDGVGMVYGLLVLSGTLGRDLIDHLKHGLRIGTSSSGFGRLLPDGVTVDPDTYIIERLGDCVLAPSQSTYFSYDEGSNDMIDTSIKESTEENAPKYVENTEKTTKSNINTNKVIDINENFMEKAVSDHKFTKLEEKRFRRDMLSFLENAEKNIKDPQERLKEFRDIESYLEDGACPDLREQIESKIKAEEDFIKTAIAEKIEMRDTLKLENTADLKKKLTQIVEDASILDKEAKDWKKVSESLQEKLLKSADALKKAEEEIKSRPTVQYAESLEVACKDLKTLNESINSTQIEVCGKYMEKTIAAEAKAAEYEAKTASLQEEVDYLKGATVAAIKGLKTIQEKFDTVSAENKTLKEAVEKLSKANNLFKETLEKQRAQIEESIEQQNRAQETIKSYRESNEELKAEKTKAVDEVKVLSESSRRAEVEKELLESMTPSERFYNEVEAKYGDVVKPFKERICNAMTLKDAKHIFFCEALANTPESREADRTRNVKNLEESVKKKVWGDVSFDNKGYTEKLAEKRGWM